MMPGLNIPDSLTTAAIETFSRCFLMECHAEQGTDYFIRNIDSLPITLFNTVVADIINKIGICDMSPNKDVLLTHILTEKLTHLDLTPLIKKNLFPRLKETLSQAMPFFRNLVSLCISGISYITTNPDDNILCLRAVGEHCTSLKFLDIKWNNVSDQSLMCLVPSNDYGGCPELKELHIEDCGISPSAVAQLLEELPNISYLGYEEMGKVLTILHKNLQYENKNVQLKLKYLLSPTQYLEDKCRTCESEHCNEAPPLMLCFSKLCPEIEVISVKSNKEDVNILQCFPNVSNLTLYFDDLFSSQLETIYFTDHGNKLTSLKFECSVFKTDVFITLGKTCPNLKELSVVCWIIDNNLKLQPREKESLEVFTILSSFSFCSAPFPEGSMAPVSVLQFVLKCTHSLTHLKFACNRLFSDARFKELWNNICTQSLLSLHILYGFKTTLVMPHKNNLTMSTVRLILDSCPVLKKLGDLNLWNISEEEMESLKAYLKKSNYDLEVT